MTTPVSLTDKILMLLTDPVTGPEHICAGPRIGVDYAEEAKDFPWRFWLEKEN